MKKSENRAPENRETGPEFYRRLEPRLIIITLLSFVMVLIAFTCNGLRFFLWLDTGFRFVLMGIFIVVGPGIHVIGLRPGREKNRALVILFAVMAAFTVPKFIAPMIQEWQLRDGSIITATVHREESHQERINPHLRYGGSTTSYRHFIGYSDGLEIPAINCRSYGLGAPVMLRIGKHTEAIARCENKLTEALHDKIYPDGEN